MRMRVSVFVHKPSFSRERTLSFIHRAPGLLSSGLGGNFGKSQRLKPHKTSVEGPENGPVSSYQSERV